MCLGPLGLSRAAAATRCFRLNAGASRERNCMVEHDGLFLKLCFDNYTHRSEFESGSASHAGDI